MATLTQELTRQIEDQAEAAFANLRESAGRIAQAEQLAQRLQSSGVNARAFGQAHGPHIAVWVTAGPIHADRLNEVLTRLDLVETNRWPGVSEWEIGLQGISVPLHVLAPDAHLLDA